MNWTPAMHCLSSSFVLATARGFEGLINTQSLERSWYSYPNKSNVLDDITEVLSPLIYICVRECTVCQFMEEKHAFYQLPDMCFPCTWKQEYKCTHAKSPFFIWAARLSETKELLLLIIHISWDTERYLINWLFFYPVNGILWVIVWPRAIFKQTLSN